MVRGVEVGGHSGARGSRLAALVFVASSLSLIGCGGATRSSGSAGPGGSNGGAAASGGDGGAVGAGTGGTRVLVTGGAPPAGGATAAGGVAMSSGGVAPIGPDLSADENRISTAVCDALT